MTRTVRTAGRLALILAIVAVGAAAHAQTQPAAPAPFADVITVIKNTAASKADQQALVGKVFAGDVTVTAVRFSSTDLALALVEVEISDVGAQPASAVHMRFEVRRDDPKLLELRPSQTVRFKGTLKQFSAVPVFEHTVIG